jgi:hypothetical protein
MAETTIKVTRDVTDAKLAELDAGIERFVKKGVDLLEEKIKLKMAPPKAGRTYQRKTRVHIASAPGEAPAIDSGSLIGSIQQVMESSLERQVGTNVFYAPFLESGTSRMEARPVWEVTAIEEMPTLEALLREEVGNAAHLAI